MKIHQIMGIQQKKQQLFLSNRTCQKINYKNYNLYQENQQQQYQTMSAQKIETIQTLVTYTNKLSSAVQIDEQIYCVSENGDILKVSSKQKQKQEIIFTILGHPSCLCFRTLSNSFIISDFAHESIFIRQQQNQQINNLISQYNDKSFHGPNCIKIGNYSNNLYFTDSGPFSQTSIENSVGSLYLYKFQDKSLRALCHRKLAYPSGIDIDQQQKYLLLCEMGNNRVLKFIIDESCSGNYSVFYQFNGRLGPSSICYFDNTYFVALFQFKQLSKNGLIALLNRSGELLENIQLPIGPQINSITTLQNHDNGTILLITQDNKLHKIKCKGEKNDSHDQSSLLLDKK